MKLNSFQEEFIQDAVYGDVEAFGICGGKGCSKTYSLALMARLYIEEYPGASITWTVDTVPRIDDVVDPVLKDIFPKRGWKRRSVNRRIEYHHANGVLKTSPYFVEDKNDPSSSNQEGITTHLYVTDECHALEPIVVDTALQRARGRIPDPVTGQPRESRLVFCGPPVYPDYWMARVAAMPRSKLYRPRSEVNRVILGDVWFERLVQSLSPREYQQSILGIVTPPEGQVLADWSTDPWPSGNIFDAPPEWIQQTNAAYTVLALDFGRRAPAALLIRRVTVPHPVTGAPTRVEVIIWEMQDDALTTDQSVARILQHAWPRIHAAHPNAKGKILFDKLVVDPAGQAHNDQTDKRNVDLVARHPGKGGLGLNPRWNQAGGKASVKAGLTCLQRTVLKGREGGASRTLTCLRPVWQRGSESLDKRRSWARCVLTSEYDGDVHRKDDKTDHAIDAACYWAKEEYWYDAPTGAEKPWPSPPDGDSPIAGNLGAR